MDEFKSRLDTAEAKIRTLEVKTEKLLTIKFIELKVGKYESEYKM